MDVGGNVDPLGWYKDIPPVSRAYLTAVFAVTVLVTLEIISPFDLYYNMKMITKGQVWRLVTCFLFFGKLGIHFFLHMFFAMQQSISLEQGFGGVGGSADFLFFLLVSVALLLVCAPFLPILFFSPALMQVIVYVWSKRNPTVRMALFGVVPFSGAWLPFVLVAFSLAFGQDVQAELLGIAVGHAYFFAADVWPALAAHRGWACRRVVSTPRALYWAMGSLADVDARAARLAEAEAAAARRRQAEAAEAAAGDGQAHARGGGGDGTAGDGGRGGLAPAGGGAASGDYVAGDDLESVLAAIAEAEARLAASRPAPRDAEAGAEDEDDAKPTGAAPGPRADGERETAAAPGLRADGERETARDDAVTDGTAHRQADASASGSIDSGPGRAGGGETTGQASSQPPPAPSAVPPARPEPAATISASELRRRRLAAMS